MRTMGDDGDVRQSRANLLFALVVVVIVGLIMRLGQLQIVQGEAFEALARGNRVRLLPVVAPRGQILDRHGQVLASVRPAYTVSLVHMGVRELDRSIGLLSDVLGMTAREIRQKIEKQRGRLYEPVRLMTDIPPEIHTVIEERRLDLPGVVVEVEPIRQYPNGTVAAHVLGYLGEIDRHELEDGGLAEQGYRLGDILGKTGVEKVFDTYLRGRNGGKQVEVDALGRPVRVLGTRDPVPGNDVVLTLDLGLQRVAEESLRQRMEELRADPTRPAKAVAAAAVALNPNTGEILAMVSLPAFDPNLFAGGISRDQWLELERNPLNPFTNRAIQGEYAAGSAFKMVTATAALEQNLVSPAEIFDTRGGVYWVIPKKCWNYERGGHGFINLVQGLGVSCNIVFYELGRRAGIEQLARYAREFGLGEKTGLKDLPGEREGLIPTPAWKARMYPADPRWYLAETLDAAIGQGFHQYTPLQMAVYTAVLANGGIRYRPYLVKEVRAPDGRTLAAFGPEETGRAQISPRTLDIVRQGMLAVTAPGGTAAWAFQGFPVKVAGKTGTVETGDPAKDDHAWFVAYAPYENPQIAVAVLVEQGRGGSVAAAPVARAMLEYYFNPDRAAPVAVLPAVEGEPPPVGD